MSLRKRGRVWHYRFNAPTGIEAIEDDMLVEDAGDRKVAEGDPKVPRKQPESRQVTKNKGRLVVQ